MIQILIKGKGGWINYSFYEANQVERAIDDLEELRNEHPKLNWRIKFYDV